MRAIGLFLLVILGLCVGTDALAAISGIGSVASNVTSNLSAIAKTITAASYVAGMGFAVGAIVKFKAHKDNPTQIPISAAMVPLFVSIALIFAPTVFKVTGETLFAQSGTVAGPSGVATFGATKASG